MAVYYDAVSVLSIPSDAAGSLKSRIFSNNLGLKSQPAQIYALIIETCKWSLVLKEVIEKAKLLELEKKLTPVLALLLVHDLLLAKRGIALPPTHGLRTTVERHKARIQAEFTKARISRRLASLEAFTDYIEAGEGEGKDGQESLYPRWIRVNTLKSTLDEQLQTTFASFTQAESIDAVRKRGSKCFLLDEHIPNLIALSANISLAKSEAYKNGSIIFQDKASCFPAYLLDPDPEDGQMIDTCAAPGNKTTHIGAILKSHNWKTSPIVHAFEKNKIRALTLEALVTKAGANQFTKIYQGQDFLQVKPENSSWKHVGALLLDPSCSGSGIVGRDEMPVLHLPTRKDGVPSKPHGQAGIARRTEARKRKRDEKKAEKEEKSTRDINPKETMVDDDGTTTAISSTEEYNARLEALSKFQLELLEHAFKFPNAKKITYSTCSIHAEENEHVVMKALQSKVAKQRGWKIMERKDQVDGLRRWPVRGGFDHCAGDEVVAEACIRTNKDDGFGTMGFFVAGFIRDGKEDGYVPVEAPEEEEKPPGTADHKDSVPLHTTDPSSNTTPTAQPPKKKKKTKADKKNAPPESQQAEDVEWTGFDDGAEGEKPSVAAEPKAKKQKVNHHPPKPHTFLGKSRSLMKKGKRK